jgi:predicted regulator of Ras-like GTPase activity (Roadblock/LC7/MglB family)
MGTSEKSPADGFEGAMAGLGLSDIIQLNAGNRFSGCISVQYGADSGHIFFRDGDVVHAEQGGRSGEEAFYDMLEWRSGSFALQPNVTTTSRTIQKKSQHLLLEAHRVIDERRTGRTPPPSAGESQSSKPTADSVAAVLERLRQVPQVAYAAVITHDGACVADGSFEGETLAAQTAFLSMIGEQLGTILGAGPMQSAVAQGAKRHLVLLATKTHHLSVLVEGDAEVGTVEPEIRKVLSNR